MEQPALIAAGNHLELVRREGWEYARRRQATGVVAILAETVNGELVLTEQRRIPVDARVVDLPAGLVGDGASVGEPQQAAAARELSEETGFTSSAWTVLGAWPTSPGLTNEVVTLWHATRAVRTTSGGGVDGEDIAVHLVARADVRDWLAQRHASGAVIDPKVFAALYLLR